jgi:hypothetical protein
VVHACDPSTKETEVDCEFKVSMHSETPFLKNTIKQRNKQMKRMSRGISGRGKQKIKWREERFF